MPAEQGKPLGSMVISLGLDSADFQKSLAGTQRATKAAMTEMKAQMGIATSTGSQLDKLQAKHEGLTKVLKSQENEVKYLNKQHQEAVTKYGENSKQATNLANKINNLVGKMGANKKALADTNSALNSLTSDSAKLTKEMDLQARESQALAAQLRAQGKESQAVKVEEQQLSREMQNRNKLIDLEKSKLSTLISEKGKDSTETRQQALKIKELETANLNASKSQKNLGSAFNESGAGVDRFQGKLVSAWTIFKGTFLAQATLQAVRGLINAIKGFFSSAIDRVDALDVGAKSLKVLIGNAKDVQLVMDGVSKAIKGTPIAMNQMMSATKGLVASGMDVKKVGGVLQAVADSAYGLANGGESIDQISAAFKSLQSSGQASLGDLTRLEDANIPAVKILANQYKKSVPEMKKEITKGMISSTDAIQKLVDGMENGTKGAAGTTKALKGLAKTAGNSISGSFANMKSAINRGMADAITPFKGDIIKFFNTVGTMIEPILGSLGIISNAIRNTIMGLVNLLQGNWAEGSSFLEKLFPNDIVQKIILGVTAIRDTFDKMKPTLVAIGESVKQYLITAFNTWMNVIKIIMPTLVAVFNALKPILMQVVTFVKGIIDQIRQFWDENGTMIMNAIKNIMVVVKPILLILVSVIGGILQNIMGIIKGALNVIMGVIKIFAGLFTGNFSKMWEGVKQVFSGAIQFLWNWIQVAFVGRILGAGKGLLKGFTGIIKNMWGAVKGFFTQSIRGILVDVAMFPVKVISFAKSMASGFIKIITGMWTKSKSLVKMLIDFVINMPSKMAKGIRGAGSALTGAFKAIWNGVLKAVGKPINAIIDGVKWVLSKFGSKKKMAPWAIPQYAKGTDGHPGGLAMINDGGGVHRKEMVTLPNGQSFIPEGRNIIAPLPQGTQVMPARQTMMLARKGLIPRYAKGTKGFVGSAIDKVKDFGAAVKQKAFDVWDFISQPSKLVSKVLGKFVNFSGIGGIALDIGKSIVGTLKGSMASLFKREGESSGVEPAGKGVQRWAGTVAKALAMNGLPTTKPYVNAWLNQIATESGGNPKAVQGNIGDINNRTGDLAKGLVQVIGATFRAYKFPGHGNRLNGLDSLLAGINYAKSRYGAKGMLSMIGKGHGYANGGIIRSHGLYEAGEGNKPEMIIPLTRKARAVQLLDQAQRIIGVKDKNDKPIIQTGGGNFDTSNLEVLVMQLIDVVQGKRLVIDKNAIVDTADDGLGTRYDNADYFAGGA
ncbi:hypothetical protein A2G24_00980 [Listeria monocytogenes]|uniref:Tape measure protein N-terminal domain-containing protein n=1 Tax=Listeria monocytogenes TaxID=1639 RepID=A0A823DDJ4_LISMN|nr:hypothetical protein [Listeria monocytogenes]EAD1012199.1 hypothetical protein [Listeria monocytogenes]EAD1186106.1 hypothetical protein [Listeria monocytogenes]EAF8898025.1 hypothetical protein [Listeria monocytogenes]